MEREEKMQFAVLIDAENVSARYVQVIFDELEKYGFASWPEDLRQLVQRVWLEGKYSAGVFGDADSAVFLHIRQKQHGYGYGY